MADFGSLPDWLSAAMNVGQGLAGASAGRAQGRIAEADQNRQQNNAAVNLYKAQLAAPGTIAHNAVKGDILSRAQDVTFGSVPSTIPVPTISGGLRPSMFSPETRATGVGITSNALASAAALQPVQTPVLPDLPQAGGLDTFLNSASAISGVLGGGGKDGAGSSFSFGSKPLANYIGDLFKNHGGGSGGFNEYGPWEPGDPASPYKVYGPNEPMYGTGLESDGGAAGGTGSVWGDNQDEWAY